MHAHTSVVVVVVSAREKIKQGGDDVVSRAEGVTVLHCTCWEGFREMVTFEQRWKGSEDMSM